MIYYCVPFDAIEMWNKWEFNVNIEQRWNDDKKKQEIKTYARPPDLIISLFFSCAPVFFLSSL